MTVTHFLTGRERARQEIGPHMVRAQNGTAVAGGCHDYLPFGEEIYAPIGQRSTSCYPAGYKPGLLFTGQLRDAWGESQLDYFGARYFSGAQGRFTSPDAPFADQYPEDPQSWNLYSYVRNRPLVMVDPTGRDALWVVNRKTGETTVRIPVRFTGSGATKDNIAAIVNRVNSLDREGSPIRIEVIPTDRKINGVLNTMDFTPGLNRKMCGDAGECVNRLGGNRAHIDSSAASGIDAAAHDVLHFAGISDQYEEGPRDSSGNRTSKPSPGFDDTNIMTSRSGTTIRPEQIQEAKANRSTKHCTTDESGNTKCK